jgi:2-dehydro-3-deoxygluconokinase
MGSGATIVTFGEAMFRLTVPGHARLEDVDQLQVDVAGAELNVAVALASLGIASTWISAVPDSPVGRRVELAATASGVMIGSVVRVPETRLGVFYVENGVAPRPISVW